MVVKYISPAIFLLLSSSLMAQQTLVNRYTAVDAKPTKEQINPLLAVIKIGIPRDVVNVGSAIKYVLSRTGYTLSVSAPEAENVFTLSLPEIHRDLGPMSVEDVLRVLGGSEFDVNVDHIKRQVVYRLKNNFINQSVPQKTLGAQK